jgi:uncharacterized protein (TIGR02001 family)
MKNYKGVAPLLVSLFLLTLSGVAHSAEPSPLTGNVSLTTDYKFRGISQSQNSSAIQGGVDYADKGGFYIGNWNSSVSTQLYPSGSGVQSDVYAGYKQKLGMFTVDVGSYNYFYPKAKTAANSNVDFNTNEGYVGVGVGPVVVKYNRSFGNYFGIANSNGSQYIQGDLSIPVVKNLKVVAHAGYTDISNRASRNYKDYNFGAVYTVQGWDVSAKYFRNASAGSTFTASNFVNSEQLYKNTVGITAGKSF